MDALEFLRERKRMCKSFNRCSDGCPVWRGSCKLETGAVFEWEADKQVEIVKEWATAHPRKTRQSVFLEQCPDAIISDDELPEVAPCQLCAGLIHGGSVEDCENRGLCVECRREFWMQEVE